MHIHLLRTAKVLGGVLALSSIALLGWMGCALACSPLSGDSWFDRAVTVNTRTLPKGFLLREGVIKRTAARECVLGEPSLDMGRLVGSGYVGERLDGLQPIFLAYLGKHQEHGDGRPAHAKVPKAEAVKREVFCDPQRYVTQGRLSYRRVDRRPNEWVRHMELDLGSVGNVITTRSQMSGSASEYLYIERVDPASFCMISAERVFDDAPNGPWPLGRESLSLADLLGMGRQQTVTDKMAAEVRTFEVVLDCYASKSALAATVHYSLKKSYTPDRNRRSIQTCDRMSHRH